MKQEQKEMRAKKDALMFAALKAVNKRHEEIMKKEEREE